MSLSRFKIRVHFGKRRAKLKQKKTETKIWAMQVESVNSDPKFQSKNPTDDFLIESGLEKRLGHNS